MRVIAGAFKGRRLKSPSWPGLRPTSDKLRETLFNVLGARMAGARVVDAFAGTGAVGIEALSRGASEVIFIERDPRAVALIEENLAHCGIDAGFRIHRADAGKALTNLPAGEPFDAMIFDPPYEMTGVADVLDAAAAKLASDGIVVLERATRREPDIPPSLVRIRDIKSGDSSLTFFQRRN